MIDHCDINPDENGVIEVRTYIACLLKIPLAEHKTYRNAQSAMRTQQDSSLPLSWPRNCESKTITIIIFHGQPWPSLPHLHAVWHLILYFHVYSYIKSPNSQYWPGTISHTHREKTKNFKHDCLLRSKADRGAVFLLFLWLKLFFELKKIYKDYSLHTGKFEPNHLLKDEDQLATHVKVIPGEVSLLWQVGSYGWLIPHDHDHKHPFYKVNIGWKQFIINYYVSYLMSEIHKW